MRHFLFTAAFLFAATFTAYSQTSLSVGSTAPLFTAASIDGAIYDLNELKGNVVVLTFWSTRCEICRVEFPKLNKLVRSYDGKNAVFLAVTMHDEDRVNVFLRNNTISAKVLPNSFGIVLQYADRDRNGNIDMGFPSYFVVDKAGKIQYRSSGYDRLDQLNSTLVRLGAN